LEADLFTETRRGFQPHRFGVLPFEPAPAELAVLNLTARPAFPKLFLPNLALSLILYRKNKNLCLFSITATKRKKEIKH